MISKDELIAEVKRIMELPPGERPMPTLLRKVRQDAHDGKATFAPRPAFIDDRKATLDVSLRVPDRTLYASPLISLEALKDFKIGPIVSGHMSWTHSLGYNKVVKDGKHFVRHHYGSMPGKPKCWVEGHEYKFRDILLSSTRMPAE